MAYWQTNRKTVVSKIKTALCKGLWHCWHNLIPSPCSHRVAIIFIITSLCTIYSDKTAKLILGRGTDILPIYHFFLNPFSLACVFITKCIKPNPCNWLDIILVYLSSVMTVMIQDSRLPVAWGKIKFIHPSGCIKGEKIVFFCFLLCITMVWTLREMVGRPHRFVNCISLKGSRAAAAAVHTQGTSHGWAD